ncbi:MAG: signal peptide peptidase SppA, partial [Nitrospinaceae bacterium]
FNVQLTPAVSPLEEKVVGGKGDHKILIVHVEGFISNSKKRTFLGGQTDAGLVERIREILAKAEKDDAIEALVLRINSPGGTVTSSDMIYHELKAFKERRKLKVYALVMDMAASGGYYIAQAADKIIAHPTSLTGSIGVITIKVNAAGLMDKVGLDWEVIKSGAHKDFLSPFRSLTREERRLFQETIDSFHERFVETIAENRKDLNLEAVRSLADGRVYTSEQAMQRHLIDHVAYWDGTEEIIRKDLGVADLKFVTYHRPGEYKTNLYSALPSTPAINLFQFNFKFLPENPGPHFLYLWMP